jgi:hypothetical protein
MDAVTTDMVVEYKLGMVTDSVSGYADYAGMISIPYLTLRGGVCAIKVRQPHNCEPSCKHSRYLQAAGESRLYNTLALERADHAGYVGICEGEFDAMILTSLCGIPSVGIPGVDTWHKHPEWSLMFRGYKRVLIFRDNDEPDANTGRRPGLELAKRLAKDIDTAEIITLACKDATDTYLQHGPAEVRRAAGL